MDPGLDPDFLRSVNDLDDTTKDLAESKKFFGCLHINCAHEEMEWVQHTEDVIQEMMCPEGGSTPSQKISDA